MLCNSDVMKKKILKSREKNTRNNLTGKKIKDQNPHNHFTRSIYMYCVCMKEFEEFSFIFCSVHSFGVWQIQWSIKIVYITYIHILSGCAEMYKTENRNEEKKLNFSNTALLLFALQFSACGPQTCRILYCIPGSFSIMLGFDYMRLECICMCRQ